MTALCCHSANFHLAAGQPGTAPPGPGPVVRLAPYPRMSSVQPRSARRVRRFLPRPRLRPRPAGPVPSRSPGGAGGRAPRPGPAGPAIAPNPAARTGTHRTRAGQPGPWRAGRSTRARRAGSPAALAPRRPGPGRGERRSRAQSQSRNGTQTRNQTPNRNRTQTRNRTRNRSRGRGIGHLGPATRRPGRDPSERPPPWPPAPIAESRSAPPPGRRAGHHA